MDIASSSKKDKHVIWVKEYDSLQEAIKKAAYVKVGKLNFRCLEKFSWVGHGVRHALDHGLAKVLYTPSVDVITTLRNNMFLFLFVALSVLFLVVV